MKKLELASARTCGPRESIVKQAFRGACPQILSWLRFLAEIDENTKRAAKALLDNLHVNETKEGATVKSHPLNNAFQHGVTAWRLVTRSALSNFVIVRRELYHNGGRHDKRED